MIILGIETSCDETAISVVKAEGDFKSLRFEPLGSSLHSQVETHRLYGGVVPRLAKREHQKNLLPVLIECLRKANFKDELWDMNHELWKEKNQKKIPIDLIAVTIGPGLEPALWTGIKFAEELGEKWNVPVIGANHMEGHIVSVLLNKTEELSIFPALALLISGGHTELVLLKSWIEKEKIGETKDDAVGEAFDKVARMLDLPYPGGPEISRLAEQARKENTRLEIQFPRPMIHSGNFDFSFSGLKTAVLYYLRRQTSPPSPLSPAYRTGRLPRRGGRKETKFLSRGEVIPENIKIAVAREFEDAVVETLVSKTRGAVEKYQPKTLIVGGGVIANKTLRENFLKLGESYGDMKILIPEKSFATDNATMIAAAGYIEYLRGNNEKGLRADGNLNIG